MKARNEVTEKKTYSQIVEKKQETVVLVKPKDESQKKSSTTREIIQEKINPSSIGACVSRIKHVRDGAVAICCSDKKSSDNIVKDVENKLSEEYEVSVLKKRNPRIKVINVNKNDAANEEQLVEKIVFQNRIKTDEKILKIKMLYKYETKNQRNYNIVLEVDPNTYTQINRAQVMHIGWKNCKFVDYINVIQCYKCCKYGHMEKACKSDKQICARCAKEHKIQECPIENENKICSNCKYAAETLHIPNINYNHSAFDKHECESYKRIYNNLKSRIEYPEIFNNNQS